MPEKQYVQESTGGTRVSVSLAEVQRVGERPELDSAAAEAFRWQLESKSLLACTVCMEESRISNAWSFFDCDS